MQTWVSVHCPVIYQLAFVTLPHVVILCLLECNAAIHKKCIDKVIAKCTGSAINSKETMVSVCFTWFASWRCTSLPVRQKFHKWWHRAKCVSWWFWCLLMKELLCAKVSPHQALRSHVIFSPSFHFSSAPCQREFMCTKAWENLTPINKSRRLHMRGVWLLTPSVSICVRCVFRSTRSASRSTCLTGLKSTTTKVPPSASTAGLCCGGSPSRGSNVRVRGGSFLFWFVCFVWFYTFFFYVCRVRQNTAVTSQT